MDKLSPEILSLIVGHLYAVPRGEFEADDPATRGPYTISRNWQCAVEAHTLADIEVRSTELPAFACVFSDRRRQALLRRIRYVVWLPAHVDSPWDIENNLAALGRAVHGLWGLLAAWEQAAHHDVAWPSLDIQIRYTWDVGAPATDGAAEAPTDRRGRSWPARLFLQLPSDCIGALPRVRRVTGFQVNLDTHPTTICQIAAAFPRLRSLSLPFPDAVVRRRGRRQEHRLALAIGLRELRKRLPRLERLKIVRMGGWEPTNHSFDCQNFEDDEGVDVLCESIRQLAEAGRLTHLEVSDLLISPDLFRNRRRACAGLPDPPWSGMRTLIIRDQILSPSGRWYYTGDPTTAAESPSPGQISSLYGDSDDDGDDDDDNNNDSNDNHDNNELNDDDDEIDLGMSEISDDNTERDAAANGERPVHLWRTMPDPDTFDPLITDMTDAVLHRMPGLESFCLDIGDCLREGVGLTIQCAAAGHSFAERFNKPEDTKEDKSVRRHKVWLGNDTEWEVPTKVKRMWKEWVGDRGKVSWTRWPRGYGYDNFVEI